MQPQSDHNVTKKWTQSNHSVDHTRIIYFGLYLQHYAQNHGLGEI